MTALSALSIALIALLALCTVFTPLRAHRVLSDIEYATVDGASLRLDLYLPTKPNEPTTRFLWSSGSTAARGAPATRRRRTHRERSAKGTPSPPSTTG